LLIRNPDIHAMIGVRVERISAGYSDSEFVRGAADKTCSAPGSLVLVAPKCDCALLLPDLHPGDESLWLDTVARL
jgi:hypothetical protein